MTRREGLGLRPAQGAPVPAAVPRNATVASGRQCPDHRLPEAADCRRRRCLMRRPRHRCRRLGSQRPGLRFVWLWTGHLILMILPVWLARPRLRAQEFPGRRARRPRSMVRRGARSRIVLAWLLIGLWFARVAIQAMECRCDRVHGLLCAGVCFAAASVRSSSTHTQYPRVRSYMSPAALCPGCRRPAVHTASEHTRWR